MQWSPETLTALGLPEEAAAKVTAAHQAELEALRQRHLQEQGLRCLREKLQEAGVSRDGAQLATDALPRERLTLLEDGSLGNVEQMVQDLRQQYPTLFPVHHTLPAQPPRLPEPSNPEMDVSRMSAEEINLNWRQVRSLLARL